jgi:hypothetical protein
VLLERDASGGDEDGDKDEDAGFAKGKARPVRQVLLGPDWMRDLCFERRHLCMKGPMYKMTSMTKSRMHVNYFTEEHYVCTKRCLSGLVIFWRPVLGLSEL